MATGFPVKANYATGDILTATNMNDLAGTLNYAVNATPTTATQMAGKNKIINGDFNINQRAFTTTSTTGTYGFDRWRADLSGGTATYSAQTFTPGAAPVAGYEGTNFARLAVTTGNDYCSLRQLIEDVRTLAGQTMTLSFWAKGTNPTTLGGLYPFITQVFGSGGSSPVITQSSTLIVLTANWTRYSITFTVPSITGKTIGTNSYLEIGLGQSSNASTDSWTLDLWGVQVESGSSATPFQTATGTVQGELAACQRYYWRFDLQSVNNFGFGYAGATTNGIFVIPFPVALRTAATALEQSGTTTDYTVTNALANNATTAVPAFATGSKYNCTINCATTALTVGEGVRLRGATTNAYLAWSAEL